MDMLILKFYEEIQVYALKKNISSVWVNLWAPYVG